ncbi:putative bifunctional diguanylate cyclase/phosphodiesterase [Sulfurovum sp.]|uniref:putative bifunctional diguanylate cyclase/phosphodiesterase n=1 Tax=Sulfurovum sp. TaxID=1969726 RepID=UPI00356A899A
MNLNNILTSGHSFTEGEYALKSKFILLNSLIFLSITVVFILTIVLVYHGKIFFAMANIFYILSGLYSIKLLRKNKTNQKYIIVVISLLSLLLVVIAISKYPSEEVRFVWFPAIIISSFFLGGKKLGYIVAFLSVLSIIMLEYLIDTGLNNYTTFLAIIIILFSTTIIALYERREFILKEELLSMNQYLEDKVKKEIQKRLAMYEKTHNQLQESAVKLEEQKNAFKNLAHYDTLTGLPNRLLFYDRLEKVIENAEKNDQKFSILFLDLDNFKEINDSFGHDVGDDLLKIVAEKFQNRISKSDLLARLGGDEFTLVVGGWRNTEHIASIADRLIHALSEPIYILGYEIYITVSVGISIYPDDGMDIATLLKHSDSAMYSAKNEGRNLYHFYKQIMTDQALERVTLETRMRKALENNEFIIYYQPIVNGVTSELIGLEALVRWQHPEKGLLTPDKFIHIAERTSIIIPLGEYVMNKVAGQVKDWHEKGFNPSYISINLSVNQLRHKKLLSNINNMLEKTNFRDDWLEFEITESYAMKNPEESIEVLNQIKALGVKLSIDDFGTGYSSLSHLKKLPVDKLKIDKAFISGLPYDLDDKILVATIVSLAENMNLKVVAEGVENEEQKKYLENIGCIYMQGYLFEKPVDYTIINKKYCKV